MKKPTYSASPLAPEKNPATFTPSQLDHMRQIAQSARDILARCELERAAKRGA